jgi:hypothetical protein
MSGCQKETVKTELKKKKSKWVTTFTVMQSFVMLSTVMPSIIMASI